MKKELNTYNYQKNMEHDRKCKKHFYYIGALSTIAGATNGYGIGKLVNNFQSMGDDELIDSGWIDGSWIDAGGIAANGLLLPLFSWCAGKSISRARQTIPSPIEQSISHQP